MAVLSQNEIHQLMTRTPPLVDNITDLKAQVQPNGIDLTLRELALPHLPGSITVSNAQRVLPSLSPLVFDGLGYIDLAPGAYIITYNEVVHLPRDIMALARPRSSLLRCGATVDTAVWDAGYSGRSQSLLVVYNPSGLCLERNARIVQMVFFKLGEETEGYRGTYQGENIDSP